ncbi:MAG: hypothetical protein PVF80_08820 [Gammaproteobacteria bacterium]|jgi:xanthine/CO dehydrogenase XdhC/CoxF family maturation factor
MPVHSAARSFDEICTVGPVAGIDAAPAGACSFAVIQDHAPDRCLCEQIPGRDDFGCFGLAGSAAGQGNFEIRMRQRGGASCCPAGLTCPIRIAGICGKRPA